MRTLTSILAIALIGAVYAAAAQPPVGVERRQRAATALHDGILLLHASSALDFAGDGFRQEPFFYYFTGLENTVGAVLAIDGKSGQSWLFLPSRPPFLRGGLQPEAQPGTKAAKLLGIEHVVDWSEMETFFSGRASQATVLYFAEAGFGFPELPSNLLSSRSPTAPIWLQPILQKWSAFEAKDATERIEGLMEVQNADEIASLRTAAKATVPALLAGMRAIRPNVSQRSVEAVVESTCWKEGARGTSFWPWAMAGENAVFPRPFFSVARYDHLNRTMLPGELVRLDVGCEWDHYIGDLGRTVPVSGHYADDQRETWSIFVAAYHAGAKALREGVTVDQVFEAWRMELVNHRASAKSQLARHAIDSWSDRKNVPFWQVHTTNLVAGHLAGPLKAGTTVNYEPITSVDGQGFFLEDTYLITRDGAELLTPGVPYSAEDIEAAMR
jgi:Xaa-Pro aminopeptidase